MRLADFILCEMEAILVQWKSFAALLPISADMKSRALRDHAQQILQAVAKDLSTAQTREAQAEKPMGRAPCSSARRKRLRRRMPSYERAAV